jgi:hypothetical protein
MDMMEAGDYHSEEHTFAEFVEFGLNGRNAKSGTLTTTGVCRYLEGDKAAGGQLVGPEEEKLRPDQERLHHRPAQGHAGARPRGGAHPALTDL